MEGYSKTSTNCFDGYIVDITTTHYCGTNGNINIYIYYSGGTYESATEEYDSAGWICGDNWFYQQTWIPPTRSNHPTYPKFRVEIRSVYVSAKSPNVFDEI